MVLFEYLACQSIRNTNERFACWIDDPHWVKITGYEILPQWPMAMVIFSSSNSQCISSYYFCCFHDGSDHQI